MSDSVIHETKQNWVRQILHTIGQGMQVLLFFGSSWMCKQIELKSIAEDLHQGFIHIDLQQFQQVSDLIGGKCIYFHHFTELQCLGIPGFVGPQNGVFVEQLRQFPNAVVFLENVEVANSSMVQVLLDAFDGILKNPLTGKTFWGCDCSQSIWLLSTSLGEAEVAAKADKLRRKKQIHFTQSMKPLLLEKLNPGLGKRIEAFIPVLPSWQFQRQWVTLQLKRFRLQIYQVYR